MSFDSPSDSAASSSSANSGKKRTGLPNPTPKNPSSRNRPFKKPPFADFGSYMAEKNRKPREQFDASASASASVGDSGGDGTGKGIFSGVSIFVDGFTVPSNQELKAYMLKHGGRFENYFSRQRVTHIVCSNLPDSKMKNLRAFSRGLPVVKPAWILESVIENKLLSWVPYQLIEPVNESGKQRKLSSFFAVKSNSISSDLDIVNDPFAKLDTECPDSTKRLLPPGEEKFSNCKWPDGDESVSFEHERVCKERDAEAKLTDLEDEQSVVEASDSSPYRLSDTVSGCMDIDNCPTTSSLGASNQHHSTLGDPNFVENYFKNSRLHFIGTWRNRYRKRFCSKLSGVKHSTVHANSISTAQKLSVIHIDMDSFFVSVVIRNYPELVNKPVAVCHSDSPKGTAEISSANYPAREYGVKAGMFVRDAKARCPHLVIVPYDFEAYEEVADQFYTILHKHCNKVQAVSCDEAYLDVTESASNDPEHLALMIRKEIAETTRCTASAGIAENILLARLATRSAKPNGQCFISPVKVNSYLEELPIKALPGIGHSLGEKLKSRQIHTCGQLRLISKETLHKDFGTKTGDMLWNYCRGIDNRAVGVVQETKSVGAEVNWGVRFNDIVECEKFLLNLCKEVSFRLQEFGVEGRTITLKVKKRRKGAEEPTNFMGCGDCENISRSMTLPLATDDIVLLERIAKKIFASFHTDVRDVRGVGLQISRLETVDSRNRKDKDASAAVAGEARSDRKSSRSDDPAANGDKRDDRDRDRSDRRDRDREKEKDHRRERENDRDRERRSRDRDYKERDRDGEKEKGRDREREREKERERERERERSRRSSSRSRHEAEREMERARSGDRVIKERELERETRERESRRFKDKKDAVELEADPERDQRTVFAYQMPLKANERDVYEFFSKAGKVRDVRLIMDRNSRRSKGVGYIEFYDAMSVPMAIAISGQLLLGQPVMVKPSEAEKNLVQSTATGASGVAGAGAARKIYVGNLHFNISEDQLRQVFEPFGPVELVQLPLDLETGQCKGYGFVQFAQIEHAKAAQSLNGKLEIAGRVIKVSAVTDHITVQETGANTADFDDDDGGGLSLNARSRAMLMQKLDRTGTASSIAESLGVPLVNGVAQPSQQALPLPANGHSMLPAAPGLLASPLAMPVAVPIGEPSECILLKNMFDPRTETDPDFDLDIRDEVQEECSRFGPVKHIYVDKHSDGHVYLRFETVTAAASCQHAMHMRWFAGRAISATYMRPYEYDAKFASGAA